MSISGCGASNCSTHKAWEAAFMVVVVVECIYQPYVFSHSVATSSAECNRCSSLQLGLWAAVDNMWHCLALPQGHVSCCNDPLLATGCAVALFGPEVIHGVPSSIRIGRILVAGQWSHPLERKWLTGITVGWQPSIRKTCHQLSFTFTSSVYIATSVRQPEQWQQRPFH